MVGNLIRHPRVFAHSTQTAALSRPAATGASGQADNVLRELAFVLHLTRSVKQRILEERETAACVSLALAATDDGI